MTEFKELIFDQGYKHLIKDSDIITVNAYAVKNRITLTSNLACTVAPKILCNTAHIGLHLNVN